MHHCGGVHAYAGVPQATAAKSEVCRESFQTGWECLLPQPRPTSTASQSHLAVLVVVLSVLVIVLHNGKTESSPHEQDPSL